MRKNNDSIIAINLTIIYVLLMSEVQFLLNPPHRLRYILLLIEMILAALFTCLYYEWKNSTFMLMHQQASLQSKIPPALLAAICKKSAQVGLDPTIF